MYAREVDGKKLTLGVSGLLWNRSLVMYDKETGTLWSQAKAWGFDLMLECPAINDEFHGKPVLVAFDGASMTPRLYERTLESRVLTFRMVDGKLTDEQTGSAWEPVTGRATAGPLTDQYLKPLTAIVSYDRVWLKFHPDSSTSHASAPPEPEPVESN